MFGWGLGVGTRYFLFVAWVPCTLKRLVVGGRGVFVFVYLILLSTYSPSSLSNVMVRGTTSNCGLSVSKERACVGNMNNACQLSVTTRDNTGTFEA